MRLVAFDPFIFCEYVDLHRHFSCVGFSEQECYSDRRKPGELHFSFAWRYADRKMELVSVDIHESIY